MSTVHMTTEEMKNAAENYEHTIVEEQRLVLAGVPDDDTRLVSLRSARRETLERAGFVRPLDPDPTSDWN